MRRRLSLLICIMMFCSSVFASTIPIRELGNQLGAKVDYNQDSKCIKFTVDNKELVIDTNKRTITDQFGNVIKGVEIKSENGVTYVESEDILSIIKKENSSENIREYLNILTKNIVDIFYAASDVMDKTAKLVAASKKEDIVDSSSYIVSSSRNVSTTGPEYEIVDVHVRDVWIVPAVVRNTNTTPQSCGYITTSSTLNAVHCIWISCGLKSSKDYKCRIDLRYSDTNCYIDYSAGYACNFKDGKTVSIGYLLECPSRSEDIPLSLTILNTGQKFTMLYKSDKENDDLYYGNEDYREVSNDKLSRVVKQGTFVYR